MQVPIPYPSAILIREKAICVSLEHIRMVVGTNEVRGCLRERERARPPAALPVHEPARGAVENSYRTSCTSTRCKRALGSVRQQCAFPPHVWYGLPPTSNWWAPRRARLAAFCEPQRGKRLHAGAHAPPPQVYVLSVPDEADDGWVFPTATHPLILDLANHVAPGKVDSSHVACAPGAPIMQSRVGYGRVG